MIQHPAFSVEPWAVRETRLHLDVLAQTESVFALANGHIGLRGNLDEGEPSGLPGTYLNAFCELRPWPYAEAGYGDPESGQTVVNVTNGKLIRLLVDDEPFDVRYGELRAHERLLDLRAGVLKRRVEWVSPTGRPVRVSSVRLVSRPPGSWACPPSPACTRSSPGSLLFAMLGRGRQLPVGTDSTIAPVPAAGVAALAAVGTPRYAHLVSFLGLMAGVLLIAVGLLRLGWIGGCGRVLTAAGSAGRSWLRGPRPWCGRSVCRTRRRAGPGAGTPPRGRDSLPGPGTR